MLSAHIEGQRTTTRTERRTFLTGGLFLNSVGKDAKGYRGGRFVSKKAYEKTARPLIEIYLQLGPDSYALSAKGHRHSTKKMHKQGYQRNAPPEWVEKNKVARSLSRNLNTLLSPQLSPRRESRKQPAPIAVQDVLIPQRNADILYAAAVWGGQEKQRDKQRESLEEGVTISLRISASTTPVTAGNGAATKTSARSIFGLPNNHPGHKEQPKRVNCSVKSN